LGILSQNKPINIHYNNIISARKFQENPKNRIKNGEAAKIEKRVKKKKALLSVPFGALAGFLNGFLGAGGGIILMWILPHLNPPQDDNGIRDNFATVVFVILLYSSVSAIAYSHNADFSMDNLWILTLPGIVGSIVGAYLTDRISTNALKIAFCILMVVAGVNMAFR